MIKVLLYKKQDGTIYGFKVKGHAGFSKKGADIVCAAVSMLVINTVNSIELIAGEKPDVRMDEAKGAIECVMPCQKQTVINDKADVLIRSLELGLQSVKQQYGDYIKISEECLK